MARRDLDDPSLAFLFSDLRADYDMARPSIYRRARVGVRPSGSGADYHYRSEAAYFGMMELARDIFRNNVVVGQGIRRFVANIIQGGFQVDPKTGDNGADDELEARWKDWSEDADQCDLEGEKTFADLEAIALQQVTLDGDVLCLPTREGPLQTIEAHRLRTPSNTSRNVVHGVLLNDVKRRMEYWVTKQEVGLQDTVSRVSDVTRYPARDAEGWRQVLHLYRPDRLSQTRGVTALAPMADTAGMGDDLFFAQLVKAQSAACYAILHEMTEAGQFGQRTDTNARVEQRPHGQTRRVADSSPGMHVFGYPGEKLSGFSPNIPNQEFFDHAMLILTFVSINLDLPLAVFLLDPSKTNFSGWRGAMDQAKIRFRQFQDWMVRHFHRRVYRWKVRQWMETDPALKRLSLQAKIDIYGHVWNAPTWPYIEPIKDVTADLLAERNAQNSPRRIQAKNGRNFWQITDEIIADNSYRIRKAKRMAQKINKKFDDGHPVHWRELISLPLPEGLTVAVGADTADGGQDSKKSDKEQTKHGQ
jgi:lambda family phage portal protein